MPLLRAELNELKKGKPLDLRTRIDEVFERLAAVYGPYSYDQFGKFSKMFAELRENEYLFIAGLPDKLRQGVRARILRVFRQILETAPRVGARPPNGTDDEETAESVDYEFSEARISRAEFGSLLDLALVTSPRRISQFLKAARRLNPDEAQTALKLIARHLGECASVGAHPGRMLRNEPTVLEIPRVQEIVTHMLRQSAYEALHERGVDSWKGDNDTHRRFLDGVPGMVRQHLHGLLHECGARPAEIHDRLFEQVEGQYRSYVEYQPPPELVNQLTIKGQPYHVPSMRQRMAVVQGLERRRILVDFNTGDGKFLTAYLLWRGLNDQRAKEKKDPGSMIFIEPPGPISDLRNRINPLANIRATHEPYLTANRPSTGAITSGIRTLSTGNPERHRVLEEELKSDIVFVSPFILGRERDDRPIYQHIIDHSRQSLVLMLGIDESQLFNGGKEWYRWLVNLALGLRDVRDEGIVAEFSATPITKRLSDYYRTLALLFAEPERLVDELDPDRAKDRRAMDPELLHAASQRYHLRVDQPTDILNQVREITWDQTPREQEHCRVFIDDPSMGFQEKQASVALAELDPRISSGDPTMPCSLQDKLTASVEALLEGATQDEKGPRNTILITESYLSQWILRHSELTGGGDVTIFAEKMRDRLRALENRRARSGIGFKPIRFHVIHGKTHKERDDARAIADAFDSRETGATQTVMMAFGDCILEGINLSCFDVIVEIESYRTQSQREQLLGRVNREGNQAEYKIMRAQGSLLAVFQDHADVTSGPINKFRRGQGGSRAQLRQIDDATDESLSTVAGTVHLGTRIAEHLTSHQRRLLRSQSWAQNGGLRRYMHYWMSDEEKRRQWLERYIFDREGPEVLSVPEHTRVAAGLLEALRADGLLSGNQVLDCNSHALGLLRAFRGVGNNHFDVESLVMHQSLGAAGTQILMEENLPYEDTRWTQGLMNGLSTAYGSREFDAIVIPDGFQNTLPPRNRMDGYENQQKFEVMMRNQRIQVPVQVWNALRDDGIMITLFPWYASTREEMEAYLEAQQYLGFQPLRQFSGPCVSTDNQAGDCSRFFALVVRKENYPSRGDYRDMLAEFLPEVAASSFQFTHVDNWSEPRQISAAKRMCGKPLLKQQLVHHEFECGNADRGRRKFSFVYKPSARTKQITTLNAVSQAVEEIRQKSAAHGDPRFFSAEIKEEMRSHGVFPLPAAKHARDASFVVRLDVDTNGIPSYSQRIQPFDPKWNELVKTSIPPVVSEKMTKPKRRKK